MNLQNKKAILTILLSISLGASSLSACDKKTDNPSIQQTIDSYLDRSEFYNSEKNGKTYRDYLESFYENYLASYKEYMSNEQKQDFLDIVKEMDKKELKDLEKTYNALNALIIDTEQSFGRGIKRAFNSRLLAENISEKEVYHTYIYKEFNTLRSLVNNDQKLFSSIFSDDMDLFIECIEKSTCYSNRENIIELINIFDAYSDLIESGYVLPNRNNDEVQSDNINYIILCDSYGKRIKEIITDIIKHKLQNDANFKYTLYGKILEEGKYLTDNVLYAHQNLLGNEFVFSLIDGDICYHTSSEAKFLYSEMDIAEFKKNQVVNLIEDYDFSTKDTYKKQEMDLMLLLLNREVFESKTKTEEIREKMYEELGAYFDSPEQFDDFFLSLGFSDAILYKYFEIMHQIIISDGITYDDFICYTALRNYISKNTYIDRLAYFSKTGSNLSIDEIENTDVKEASKTLQSVTTNYIFGGIDYHVCLDILAASLKNNDLGYELIYAPDCYYNCSILDCPGAIDGDISVISSLINPKFGVYQGINVIYYEIPESFKKGIAVDAYYNIKDKLTINQIEGIREKIYDLSTKEFVDGFITSLNATEEELTTTKPIRFAEYYTYFQELSQDKKPLKKIQP